MAEVSTAADAHLSNLEGLILRRVAGVKNATIAQAIGHDEGHVSRITSRERGLRINELGAFFESIGLRVIECDGPVVSLPEEELNSIRYLARKALS